MAQDPLIDPAVEELKKMWQTSFLDRMRNRDGVSSSNQQSLNRTGQTIGQTHSTVDRSISRVFEPVEIWYQLKGSRIPSCPRLAKITVTPGVIDVHAIDNKFTPPIRINISDLAKPPKLPSCMDVNWLILDCAKTDESTYLFMNLKVDPAEMAELVDTLLHAWSDTAIDVLNHHKDACYTGSMNRLHNGNGVSASDISQDIIDRMEKMRQCFPTTQELLELQQKVIKLEKDLEVACQAASKAETSVKFLWNSLEVEESRLASTIMESIQLQEKLTETSTKLEEVKREAAARELELQERVNSLTEQLGAERSQISLPRPITALHPIPHTPSISSKIVELGSPHSLMPLPKRIPRLAALHELDRIICTSYDENKITEARQKELKSVKGKLNNPIQGALRRNIRLEVYGSALNGFGTNESDLNISLSYIDENGDEKKDKTKYPTIFKIQSALQGAGFNKVHSIASLNPIVTFIAQVKSGEVEGKISYYNELALHNTSLLKRYCTWTKDNMLSKLGLFVKRWVKECDIGDVSKGSLSSYTYIILLIHFLQRVKPHPLLPVLQEIGEYKIIVDECNVYFCDAEPELDWSRCTLSVGELFLQFLEYYSKFDWAGEVVQISQLDTLAQNEEPEMMCIEDPFDLTSNLASHISEEMFIFIKKAFSTSLEVFNGEYERDVFIQEKVALGMVISTHFPIPEDSIPSYGDFLLVKCKSSIGEAPNEKCHNCGHVGHQYCTGLD